jgi:hypothetical protein
MKKLVAVAAVGVALAAIPVSIAMTRTGVTVGSDQALAQAPCYKGETLGKCPTATTTRTATGQRTLSARRTSLRPRVASQR